MIVGLRFSKLMNTTAVSARIYRPGK